jgi:hypothetical protein
LSENRLRHQTAGSEIDGYCSAFLKNGWVDLILSLCMLFICPQVGFTSVDYVSFRTEKSLAPTVIHDGRITCAIVKFRFKAFFP